MIPKKFLVYPVIIFSMIFWSLSYIWYKQVYQYFEPITTIFFRLVISTLFLVIITLLTGKLQKVQKGDLKIFILASVFQPLMYFFGESYGMKYLSSTVGSVLIGTIPIFTAIFGYLYFREKLSRINIGGIIISFAGVLLVILENDLSFRISVKGLFFMILAIFSAIAYSVMVIRLSEKYNAYTIVTVQNFIGIFLFLPLFLIFDLDNFLAVPLNISVLEPLIKLAVFASSMAFVFFTYGIRNLGITKANMFSNIIPVFTAVFAWLILGDLITQRQMAGILIVIAGLFLSQIKPSFKIRKRHLLWRRNY